MTLIVSVLLFSPVKAPAYAGEMFQSGDFLTWTEASCAAYIETSIGMASLIAAQRDRAKADCIDA